MHIYCNESHDEEAAPVKVEAVQDGKEILYMTSSADDLRLGLCIGRRHIREKLEVTDVLVYERKSLGSNFKLEKERSFPDASACITFTFSTKRHDELLFAT